MKQFSAGRNVCDIGDGKIVKYGFSVRVGEGLATRFIAENTSIPVPEIFAIATEELKNDRITYIVEEKIHGTRLLEILPTLDSQNASDIAEQLSGFLVQLSSLDHRGSGHVGVIGGSFNETGFFGSWTHFDHRMPTTTKEFVEYFVDRARRGVSPDKIAKWMSTFDFSRPPIFSHGDLVPENIMVYDGRVTGIIDWECAGWYPYFWNHCMGWLALRRPSCKDSAWKEILPQTIQPYEAESSCFSEILFYADIFG